MVAPFCGTFCGGLLYDMLLFTGESPINSPYLGLYRLKTTLRKEWDGVSWHAHDLKEDSPV
jgi:aquaglyceroporin related protein, other eukaryote